MAMVMAVMHRDGVVSVMEGSTMIVRSVIQTDTHTDSTCACIRISKTAEILVGQTGVCSAVARAFRMSYVSVSGVRDRFIDSVDVKGRPRNSRVEYAVRFAMALRMQHNDQIMQRRLFRHLGALGQAPTRSTALLVRHSGMRVDDLVGDGSECDLCAVQTGTHSVTCCIGKRVCSQCLVKLRSGLDTGSMPSCPWCRR